MTAIKVQSKAKKHSNGCMAWFQWFGCSSHDNFTWNNTLIPAFLHCGKCGSVAIDLVNVWLLNWCKHGLIYGNALWR